MSAEMESIPADTGRRKAGRPKQQRAQAVRNADLQNAGRILPNCPTTAEDLVEQWQIPSDDAYTVRVAVMKQEPGDPSPQLMSSVPVLDYDMGAIAGKFGPGLYFIKGQPHKWAVHSARFEVSEAYARANGFGRVPARAVDLVAARTLQEATKGPSDPAALLAALETMVDRKIAETRPVAVETSSVQMVPLERQAESMFQVMNIMDKMENRMMAIAERRAGLRPETDPVPSGSSTMELVRALAPYLGPLVHRMFAGPVAPQQAAPHQVAHQIAHHQAAPVEPPKQNEAAMSLPELTPDEQAKIAPTVRALKPYASMLATIPQDMSKPDAELADGLGSYIPPALYPAIMDLAAVVRLKGPGVLGYIDPALVHPRWPAILSELSSMLAGAME